MWGCALFSTTFSKRSISSKGVLLLSRTKEEPKDPTGPGLAQASKAFSTAVQCTCCCVVAAVYFFLLGVELYSTLLSLSQA